MALPNPMEAFVWGRGGAKMTPEQIAREREIAASLTAVDTSPVGHWTQGLARVANAAAGAYRGYQANKAEKANASASGDLIARMLSGGNSDFPAAPGGGGSFPAAPGSGGSAATGLGDPNGYRNAIASVESAGSGDYSAVGPTHKTMGRALGRYQVMEANIGPWSKAALGREVTPEEFMANPQIQDAIFDHQFGSYVQKYGNPQDAASAWFTGQPLSKGANRRDVLGTSGAGYVDKFNKALGSPALVAIERQAPIQVASLDPGAGMQTLPSPVFSDEQARLIAAESAIPNFRPGSVDPSSVLAPLGNRPMPEEYAATGLSPAAWERMNAPDGAVPADQPLDPASARVAQAFAADAAQPMAAPILPAPQTIADRPVAEPQQQIAQALMGPNTPLDQVPVMAGGNSGVLLPGQGQRGINPAVLEALSSPYADEQTRKIAGMLLGQQMQANDPAAQLDMRYKQAQIDALNAKPDKLPESVRALNIRAQQAGLKPGTPEYNQFMISGGTGPQTIINNGSNTSEFVKKSDEAAAKRMDEIVAAGQTAPQTMADMQQLIDLGATIGTGQGANLKAKLGPYAHALGIDIANLGDIQAYEAITSRLAPQMRATGSGSSSDRDVSMFLQSLPSLRNMPQGNEIIANTMKAVAQNKINAADLASKAQRGEITWQDADRQIRELPNPYYLFKEFQKQGSKKTVIDGYTIEQVD